MTTFVFFTVLMIALLMWMVMMSVSRPGWKWVGKISPVLFAFFHLRLGQKTSFHAASEDVGVNFQSHDRKRLAAIAVRFLPFLSGALGHFGFARGSVTSRPPFSGGRALDLRSGQVQSTHLIHAGSQPKETLGSEHTIEVVLEQVPKTVGMKRASRSVMERNDRLVVGRRR
jgi:hypothetical protein